MTDPWGLGGFLLSRWGRMPCKAHDRVRCPVCELKAATAHSDHLHLKPLRRKPR